MSECFIFDLDGTLADLSHRLKYVDGSLGKKDWRAFFAYDNVIRDEPIKHMLKVYGLVRYDVSRKVPVLIVSGRSDECRRATEDWLNNHGIYYDELHMRKAGDKRPDNQVKLDILNEVRRRGWKPVMAFDDRDQVVKMWRENGVPCAQVAEGSF